VPRVKEQQEIECVAVWESGIDADIASTEPGAVMLVLTANERSVV
jgi:hypothetical protein